jgi:hypothetical protein
MAAVVVAVIAVVEAVFAVREVVAAFCALVAVTRAEFEVVRGGDCGGDRKGHGRDPASPGGEGTGEGTGVLRPGYETSLSAG